MTDRPYYLTARQFTDGEYREGGRGRYVAHPKYATTPSNYVRAFDLMQKDLLALFEYIEPADQNCETYSFRTFELLLRICTELEANFKAIFRANTYAGVSKANLNVTDYVLIEQSHYLSQYEVRLPYWTGTRS